ncbi:lysozyme [Qipengyuania sp. XHP0207]|uniref:lysozyme n=1 Tax=Qipengyuania sp. XHP0207 TaxID=3038078 RepID=UPI00241EBED1|nr:lysozyme [Qipengyuania sp. XHP0207]MDG5748999.1 lysozyme [Qipengyuania sp. XHP0207]
MNRRPIFDYIRALLGRGLTQTEVDQLDRLLDDFAGADTTESGYPPARTIGPDGIALIKQFEGFGRLRPDGLVASYPDPGTGGEPWTIGWGSTGPGVGPDTVWTRAQADARFERDLETYAAEVANAIGDSPTTQNQFDALVSFHYNTGAIGRATLTRRHREGDYAAAAAQFGRWIRAGGQILEGLVRRRRAEANLYRKA